MKTGRSSESGNQGKSSDSWRCLDSGCRAPYVDRYNSSTIAMTMMSPYLGMDCVDGQETCQVRLSADMGYLELMARDDIRSSNP